MKFSIDYIVKRHGWATVVFKYGNEIIEHPVSYLHDSLKDLALLAKDVKRGKVLSSAVFMDEPGEVQLKVSKKDNDFGFEVLDYQDWQSWGLVGVDSHRLLMKGCVSGSRIVHQVYNILFEIHEKIGPEKYKDIWVEHDFPADLYQELLNT